MIVSGIRRGPIEVIKHQVHVHLLLPLQMSSYSFIFMNFYFYMCISLSRKCSWFMKVRFLELVAIYLLLLHFLLIIQLSSLFLILTDVESSPAKVISLELLLLLLPTIIIAASIIAIIILICHFLLVYILSIIIHHFQIFINCIVT